MKIKLHKRTRTTPAQRAFIQKACRTSVTDLADKIGASETIIRQWKKRKSVLGIPHTPKKIRTTMTPQQKSLIILLKNGLSLGLDDLLQVVHNLTPRYLETVPKQTNPLGHHFCQRRLIKNGYLFCMSINGMSGFCLPINI